MNIDILTLFFFLFSFSQYLIRYILKQKLSLSQTFMYFMIIIILYVNFA